jgi:putative addiction module component (TIGR02574 family)
MSKVADDILTTAMQLPIIDRAEIASALLASLDGEPDDGVEAAWAAEIERRIERVKSGAATGQPWAEVRKRLERSGG